MKAKFLIPFLSSVVLVIGCDRAAEPAPAAQAQAPVEQQTAAVLKKCADFGNAATVSVNITAGVAGDSVTGDFTCDGVGVVASCTATVAAGATTANCTSAPPVDLTGVDRDQGCPATVVAGTPQYGVTCSR